MRMRHRLLSLACAIIVGSSAWSDEGPVVDSPAARLDRLLIAVAAGSGFEPGAAELVPQLVKLVEDGDPQQIPLAIRALGIIGPDAAPAVNALCGRLNDPVHSHRDFASDALVAIGNASIEPLREALDSSASRVRAAAVIEWDAGRQEFVIPDEGRWR